MQWVHLKEKKQPVQPISKRGKQSLLCTYYGNNLAWKWDRSKEDTAQTLESSIAKPEMTEMSETPLPHRHAQRRANPVL